MMTLKLQIVIAIAILAILAVLVNMIRKRSLELKYALVWMMVLAALLFVLWFFLVSVPAKKSEQSGTFVMAPETERKLWSI